MNNSTIVAFKTAFINKYFMTAVAFFLLMEFIVFLGNPSINGFYIHYVPEMISLYFLGVWACHEKFPFKLVLFDYFTCTVLTPIIIGCYSILTYFIVLPFCMIISSSLLLGYVIAKREPKPKPEESKC